MTYRDHIYKILTPKEHHILTPLSTPHKVQDFLDKLPINFEYVRETCMSPRLVMQKKRAHCIEGAFFAALAFAYHGRLPYLMDFQTTPEDGDHVIALFKEHGKWGAVSKTNHAILRFRDPIYKTPYELGMSYFHEYFLSQNGKKTMLQFSKPFNLRHLAPESWITPEKDLYWLEEKLDSSYHFPSPAKNIRLRSASKIERRMINLVDWYVRKSRYKYKPKV